MFDGGWTKRSVSVIVCWMALELVSGAQPDGLVATSSDALKADALALYQRLLPAEWLDQLRQQENLRENNRVYTNAVVIWLIVTQRFQPQGTLETGVLELRGLPASFWPQPCKRLQPRGEGERPPLSSHTGAYNKARQELSVKIV